MEDTLKNMTDQQLVDRLTELTSRLSEGRGIDKGREFCKMDIEDILAEIEARKISMHDHR